jgi:hypothetical protein
MAFIDTKFCPLPSLFFPPLFFFAAALPCEQADLSLTRFPVPPFPPVQHRNNIWPISELSLSTFREWILIGLWCLSLSLSPPAPRLRTRLFRLLASPASEQQARRKKLCRGLFGLRLEKRGGLVEVAQTMMMMNDDDLCTPLPRLFGAARARPVAGAPPTLSSRNACERDTTWRAPELRRKTSHTHTHAPSWGLMVLTTTESMRGHTPFGWWAHMAGSKKKKK